MSALDAHLGAVSPDALLVSGPGELMFQQAPSRQDPLRLDGDLLVTPPKLAPGDIQGVVLE
jgi:hypothetical protein